jgi:hypothetical protein
MLKTHSSTSCPQPTRLIGTQASDTSRGELLRDPAGSQALSSADALLVEEVIEHDDYPLKAARGIAMSVLLSLGFWIAFGLAIWFF